MIRRVALMVAVPCLVIGLFAVPMGFVLGSYHWLCAAVALALTVPPTVATLIASDRLSRSSPYGRVVALFLGTAVRMVVGFGGAVVVFLAAKPTFHGEQGGDYAKPLTFLGWVLGAYLTTLVIEMALLAGPLLARSKSKT